jgi:hypothetical protein
MIWELERAVVLQEIEAPYALHERKSLKPRSARVQAKNALQRLKELSGDKPTRRSQKSEIISGKKRALRLTTA